MFRLSIRLLLLLLLPPPPLQTLRPLTEWSCQLALVNLWVRWCRRSMWCGGQTNKQTHTRTQFQFYILDISIFVNKCPVLVLYSCLCNGVVACAEFSWSQRRLWRKITLFVLIYYMMYLFLYKIFKKSHLNYFIFWTPAVMIIAINWRWRLISYWWLC